MNEPASTPSAPESVTNPEFKSDYLRKLFENKNWRRILQLMQAHPRNEATAHGLRVETVQEIIRQVINEVTGPGGTASEADIPPELIGALRRAAEGSLQALSAFSTSKPGKDVLDVKTTGEKTLLRRKLTDPVTESRPIREVLDGAKKSTRAQSVRFGGLIKGAGDRACALLLEKGFVFPDKSIYRLPSMSTEYAGFDRMGAELMKEAEASTSLTLSNWLHDVSLAEIGQFSPKMVCDFIEKVYARPMAYPGMISLLDNPREKAWLDSVYQMADRLRRTEVALVQMWVKLDDEAKGLSQEPVVPAVEPVAAAEEVVAPVEEALVVTEEIVTVVVEPVAEVEMPVIEELGAPVEEAPVAIEELEIPVVVEEVLLGEVPAVESAVVAEEPVAPVEEAPVQVTTRERPADMLAFTQTVLLELAHPGSTGASIDADLLKKVWAKLKSASEQDPQTMFAVLQESVEAWFNEAVSLAPVPPMVEAGPLVVEAVQTPAVQAPERAPVLFSAVVPPEQFEALCQKAQTPAQTFWETLGVEDPEQFTWEEMQEILQSIQRDPHFRDFHNGVRSILMELRSYLRTPAPRKARSLPVRVGKEAFPALHTLPRLGLARREPLDLDIMGAQTGVVAHMGYIPGEGDRERLHVVSVDLMLAVLVAADSQFFTMHGDVWKNIDPSRSLTQWTSYPDGMSAKQKAALWRQVKGPFSAFVRDLPPLRNPQQHWVVIAGAGVGPVLPVKSYGNGRETRIETEIRLLVEAEGKQHEGRPEELLPLSAQPDGRFYSRVSDEALRSALRAADFRDALLSNVAGRKPA
ncbi:MAG: hypothetical protein WC777_01080 [Candidatus Gracilibacteria bacterium]|jgi:hypothetical protein